MTSLPILQFEPFIMEDGIKIKLRYQKEKVFKNFLLATNMNEDKRKVAMLLHYGRDYI